jgi:ribonucleotide monophosphatase NagD (HAD superfamily)
MIGDSIDIDIYGGNTNGFETILVKTGLYKHEHESTLKHSTIPTHHVDDAYDGV